MTVNRRSQVVSEVKLSKNLLGLPTPDCGPPRADSVEQDFVTLNTLAGHNLLLTPTIFPTHRRDSEIPPDRLQGTFILSISVLSLVVLKAAYLLQRNLVYHWDATSTRDLLTALANF